MHGTALFVIGRSSHMINRQWISQLIGQLTTSGSCKQSKKHSIYLLLLVYRGLQNLCNRGIVEPSLIGKV